LCLRITVQFKLEKNLASGGLAGALFLTVVYSLDYARTRASDGIQGLYRGFFFVCLFLQPAPENQGLAAVAHAKRFFLLINAGLWSLKHV